MRILRQRIPSTKLGVATAKTCSKSCARLQSSPDFVTSFWDRVDKTPGHGPKGDCWLWMGGVKSDGYGQVYSVAHFGDKKPRLAHRTAYKLSVGQIPEGMVILHECDTPLCCNPAHHRPGTHAENVADMWKKGRANPKGMQGEDHPSAKLNEKDVIAIRKDPRHEIIVATEYGVSRSLIHAIRTRTAWKHID